MTGRSFTCKLEPMSVLASAVEPKREPRDLSGAERRVASWIKQNHGVLSRVARELGLSVAFVQRVAYNREAQSKGLRVERKLQALGCPLIQRIR